MYPCGLVVLRGAGLPGSTARTGSPWCILVTAPGAVDPGRAVADAGMTVRRSVNQMQHLTPEAGPSSLKRPEIASPEPLPRDVALENLVMMTGMGRYGEGRLLPPGHHPLPRGGHGVPGVAGAETRRVHESRRIPCMKLSVSICLDTCGPTMDTNDPRLRAVKAHAAGERKTPNGRGAASSGPQ